MTRKEEREYAAYDFVNTDSVTVDNHILAFNFFMTGAKWADKTMLDKVYDFIKTNTYKYGKVKFIDGKVSFDFRTDTFIDDLKQIVEE